MTVADEVIRSVDWSRYEVMNGPATRLGAELTEFLGDGPVEGRERLWWLMENNVFAQDDISTAAEPTITVLLAALVDDRPPPVRISVLDLLFHLVHAASFRDDDLGKRCVEKTAAGGWLLVGQALAWSAGVREACLEILDIASPECAGVVRLMEGRQR